MKEAQQSHKRNIYIIIELYFFSSICAVLDTVDQDTTSKHNTGKLKIFQTNKILKYTVCNIKKFTTFK